MTEVSRRSFVSASLVAAGGVWLGPAAPITSAAKRIRREAVLGSGTFAHGVSAGAPGQREITLWTHVDGIERSGRVTWEVATDAGFRKVVQQGSARAAQVRDFTARTVVKGLEPGEEYFYRFATKSQSSRVGRFRTARPADSKEPVRIGFFSCQDYQAGYYTAHAALAQEDVDFVVCLGDYVYERSFYVGPRRDTTGVNGDGDVQSLAEYRDKYRLYRKDANLQDVHAAHPMIAIWDDHEVEDNWAADKSGEATPPAERRSDFLERRRQAYLAFFEWMPRYRIPDEQSRIYGSVPLGGAAELFLLDTRQYRADQPCGDQLIVPCPDQDAPREMLGAAQKRWLVDGLKSSQATWKIVGTQVMVMSLDSVPGVGVNMDGWDGYGAERREVLEAVRDVKDISFLTGDIHTFFAGEVHTTGRVTGPRVATEFVGGSITSLGFEDQFGQALPAIETGLLTTNPHLKYMNGSRRGYGILEARADELRVAYRSPRSVVTPTSKADTLVSFRVKSGSARVERA